MTQFFTMIICWNISGGKISDHVLAGGNMNVGDIKGKTEIQQAYELGK